MANNYVEFAFLIHLKDQACVDRVLDLARKIDAVSEDNRTHEGVPTEIADALEGFDPSFSVGQISMPSGFAVVIESNNGDDGCAALLAQWCIRGGLTVNPWIAFELCWRCDRLRIGEFGGAAYFITADKINQFDTDRWVRGQFAMFDASNDPIKTT